MEIILVDDGSSDSSPEICDEYAAKHKNILTIHQVNTGVSAARNAGILKATGTYIGFVDSDDFVFLEMFEKLFECAEKTQADMSFCGYVYFFPEGETNIFYAFPENKNIDKDYIKTNLFDFLLSGESLNACWNKLYKRNLINEKHIEFERGRKNGEDRRFTIDCLSNCKSVCYIPYLGYKYRFVPTSAIQSPRKDYIDNMLFQYHEDFEVFEALGLEKSDIEAKSGMKLMEQTLAGISSANMKLRGKERRGIIKEIINNEEISVCLNKNWDRLVLTGTRYEKLLFCMVKRKSVLGLRTVMLAMRVRIRFVG
jgi:glycosyltransferase involved in cell wall biosynthesis